MRRAIIFLLLLCLPVEAARKFGGASTDIGVTSQTANYTKTSWLVWALLTGSGGNGFGRMFDKHTGGGTLDYTFGHDNGSSKYFFTRHFSTSDGTWSFNAPATGGWHPIVLTYDSSSAANNPVIYMDGVLQTLTPTAPTGSAVDSAGTLCIGNRVDTSGGNWNGDLGPFWHWRDRLLTPQEAFQLSVGRDPRDFGGKLVQGIPVRGGVLKAERDLISGKEVIYTGTVGSVNPKVRAFTPKRRDLGNAAISTTIFTSRRRRGR